MRFGMIARLETSFRQIRQFSSDASHELRTPLTVMKGETELALRRPREAGDYTVVLESTLEEIDRMGEQCSVWFHTVIRGDVHYIRIGHRTNIQDLSM